MSRPTRRIDPLVIESLEDRRVPSTYLQHLMDLINHAGQLPPGLVMHEIRPFSVEQLEQDSSQGHGSDSQASKPDKDAESSAPATSLVATVTNAVTVPDSAVVLEQKADKKADKRDDSSSVNSVVTPVVTLVVPPAATSALDLASSSNRTTVSDEAKPGKSAADNAATSVATTPSVAADQPAAQSSNASSLDRAPVGPLRTLVASVAAARADGAADSSSADSHQDARDKARLGAVPPPTGPGGVLLNGSPDGVTTRNVEALDRVPQEQSSRLVGDVGSLGRVTAPENDEALRAARAASTIAGSELRWTPSSASPDVRTDEAEDAIIEASLPRLTEFPAVPLATSDTTVGLAIQQFLDQLDEVGNELGRSLQQQPWAAWLVAGAMGLAAIELSRRRLQRRTRLALAGADDDTSLSWVPGLPGPFSTEES